MGAVQRHRGVATASPVRRSPRPTATPSRASCKVKLGPIALVYNGSGTFVEKDEAAHRFVVEAKGKDKRGNGTAGARSPLTMAESDGSTEVEVVTDLPSPASRPSSAAG